MSTESVLSIPGSPGSVHTFAPCASALCILSPPTRTVSPLATFTTLPLEVKFAIASFVDTADGPNLALTCRAWRHAGTAANWSTLSISFEDRVDDDVEEWEDDWEEDEEDDQADGDGENPNLCKGGKDAFVVWSLAQVRRNVFIRSSMRHFDLHGGIPIFCVRELVGIFHACSSTLSRFHLGDGALNSKPQLERFYRRLLFFTEGREFPRMVDLAIPVTQMGHLRALLSLFPFVRRLTLETFFEAWNDQQPGFETADLPRLPHLRWLRYDGCNSPGLPAAFLAAAPNLEFLHIQRDQENEFVPELLTFERLAKALHVHRNLKTLRVDGLDIDHLAWHDLRPCFTALETKSWNSRQRPKGPIDIRLHSIPPFPLMTRLTYFISLCKDGHFETVPDEYLVYVPPQWDARGDQDLNQLVDAKSLVVVNYVWNGCEDAGMHPSQWEKHNIDGCIIRTYVGHPGGRGTFFHIRSSTLGPMSFGTSERCVRHWSDLAIYRRVVISKSALQAVYKVLKEDERWLDGGRELEMPSAGWEILDECVDEYYMQMDQEYEGIASMLDGCNESE